MASAEYQKEYKATLRKLHRCIQCNNQDARTLIGKPLCFNCLEKKSKAMKGIDQSIAQSKIRQKCADNGICTSCCKRKTDGVHKTCQFCREKYKKQYHNKLSEQGKIRRSEAAEYGLCSKCLTKPRYKEYNTCYECYNEIVNRFKGTQSKSKWNTIIKADVAKRS